MKNVKGNLIPKKWYDAYEIRLKYIVKFRGVERVLKEFYAPVGGPRRKTWMIHLKMKRKFGIGLNER